MAYLGQTPAFSPLTAADITDGIITAVKIANETGTGEVVFSNTPTITTPILDNIKLGYTTTATAAGTTTLTVSSTYQQFFTGSTTQTIVLPVVSTLVTGLGYFIQNNSSGVLTVQSSGLNTITTIAAGFAALCTCISTSGTSAASWNSDIVGLNTATGTLATLAGAETLTNKTLTAPTIASANLTTALTLAGAAGTNGQVLTSAGSGLPSWTTPSGLAAATQAEMETATSNTVAATPLNTNSHPGVAKAWLKCSGDGLTINNSYNIHISSQAAGSFVGSAGIEPSVGGPSDPLGYYFACLGDQ